MRYELGDRLTGTVAYDPAAVPGPNAPAVKTDQRAKFVAFDKATGDVTFDVPALDPATEIPLAEIVVVYVPETFNGASTASDYRALPDDTCPKAILAITPEMSGTQVVLPRPESMPPQVPFLGQTLHGYADA